MSIARDVLFVLGGGFGGVSIGYFLGAFSHGVKIVNPEPVTVSIERLTERESETLRKIGDDQTSTLFCGELDHASVDGLIRRGLIRVESMSGYIPSGDDIAYCRVTLTDLGWAALA